MSRIKLFNISNGVKEYKSSTIDLEKKLQNIIEANMQSLFGVIFLATEYIISDGRIDSVGIDENMCPVIFEYKRSVNENVINQGLFYLDWLLDHKDSFKMLILNNKERFNEILSDNTISEIIDNIDWEHPRIICVANDFTKYDKYAVNQMKYDISLVRYIKYDDDLLMFEHLNDNNTKTNSNASKKNIKELTQDLKSLYEEIKYYILSLGDDITEKELKNYTAYRKIKNIICAETSYKDKIILRLRLDVNTFIFEEGFSRNTIGIGHWGTGDVELTIRNSNDFEKAKPFIMQAYNEN